MIDKLKKKYALSDKEAVSLIKGSISCAVQNITFVLPVAVLYLLIKDLLDGIPPKSHLPVYLAGSAVCIVLIFVVGWIQYTQTYLAAYRQSAERRISLAEKLRKIPLLFFGKRDLADLSDVIMKDSQQMEVGLSHNIPELYGSLISTVVIAICLFVFDWRMGLAAFWVLPVSLVILLKSKDVQKQLFKRSRKAELECEDGIQEYIETIRDLESCGAEDKYLDRLDRKIDRAEKESYNTKFGTTAFIMTSGTILKIGIGTVALTGTALLVRGEISLLILVLFLVMITRMYDPLQGVLANISAIIGLQANIDRMNEIREYPVQIGAKALQNRGYDIRFENVGFSYENGEKVLDGVSFSVRQGDVTALVGPSGGGKTTVSRLAARFWDVDSGMITVGGMDISKVDPETLMSLYSMVFQDVILFNNTILENIRIGRRDASDEEVKKAASLANCTEFVEKLPDHWNTMIGENGKKLSGGERQRISIARAFLKDAPIILLDEATASLDVENETQIQTALSRLIQDKTVVVIAHRMRTVMNADKVVVLSDGKTAEEGKPEDLLKKNGIFRKMVRIQEEAKEWTLEKK